MIDNHLIQIFNEFKAIETKEDKITYLETIRETELKYNINFDNLIEAWKNVRK